MKFKLLLLENLHAYPWNDEKWTLLQPHQVQADDCLHPVSRWISQNSPDCGNQEQTHLTEAYQWAGWAFWSGGQETPWQTSGEIGLHMNGLDELFGFSRQGWNKLV